MILPFSQHSQTIELSLMIFIVTLNILFGYSTYGCFVWIDSKSSNHEIGTRHTGCVMIGELWNNRIVSREFVRILPVIGKGKCSANTTTTKSQKQKAKIHFLQLRVLENSRDKPLRPWVIVACWMFRRTERCYLKNSCKILNAYTT